MLKFLTKHRFNHIDTVGFALFWTLTAEGYFLWACSAFLGVGVLSATLEYFAGKSYGTR